MKRQFLLLIIFVSFAHNIFATHNRAGEITYRRLSSAPGVYLYEATIVTYTNTDNTTADRDFLTIDWGDGESSVLLRTNGPDITGQPPGTTPSNGIPDGEMIDIYTKKNVYGGPLGGISAQHNYPGPGNYWLSMYDQNRNADILNIPNSVQQPFFVKSLLKINATLGQNNSPVLTYPPIDKACIGHCFYHNPYAIDPDGDSLSYELAYCLTTGGVAIPGYTYPNIVGGGSISIDAYTGNLSWCVPTLQGEYNVAIIIREWRGGYEIGNVERDMQIDVYPCADNPPFIKDINDTCIEAGQTLNVPVTATDPDNDVVTLTAIGGPLSPFLVPPLATFTPVTGFVPLTGNFKWTTACNHVREQPYFVGFKADDNSTPVNLVYLKTFKITIVGPAPKNPSALPSGSTMLLKWDPCTCSLSTLNKVLGYRIYRHSGFTGWKHGACETGVPAYTGYTLIGTTNDVNAVTYTDNNNGQGLIHGIDYCYMVVAFYGDGSLSYATDEFCNQLVKDVPIITNVSVDSTSTVTGTMVIKWIKPVADSANFDTIANPGPYEFRLMQAQGFTGSLTYNQIASFSNPTFGGLTATSYTATGLNTAGYPYTYRIDFYATNTLKGSTHTASSVYLSLTPTDNKLTLSWQEYVPWNNYKYYVYQKNSSGSFVLLDSTTTQTYTQKNLTNGATYCYKVESFGKYTDTNIVSPLINFSEEKCGAPIDLEPPCAPSFSITPDCVLGQNILRWTNPNHYCADDVIFYHIYYGTVQGEDLQLLATVNVLSDTTFVYNNPSSIAGCFAVTAVDSFMNSSLYSQLICVDNCPNYELPNVFTPNGDGGNDLFIPFPYRYVKDVDIKIYDRWGLLVFATSDPNINWDGKNQSTKRVCNDGVYFYVCKVNEIRVTGIQPHVLTGNVQILRDE